ncbi:hypothetical protein CP532_4480 [Ophiocordyceps camponoti-leonardi (nom. inval.)]|nr:hypothetical protein CP532_4480 [Ophiocordyceps camponoti-leonardi (nom. inval.)]
MSLPTKRPPTASSPSGRGKGPAVEKTGVSRFGGESPSLALLSNDDLGNLIRFDDESQQPYLDEEALLELCDAARAGLINNGYLPEPLSTQLADFLAAVVMDEAYGIATVGLPVLMHARLDKLVAEISAPCSSSAALDPTAPQPRRDWSTGRRLQRLWRARFRSDYFDIDQMRYANLSRFGRLRHVVLDDDELGWSAIASQILSGGPAGKLQFEAGDIEERPTCGPYYVTALPLLTGREELGSVPGQTRYIRNGQLSDMHLALLSRVGTPIRILRGYCLRSPLAPRAGIRYDGLYTIGQYGLKLDEETSIYRLVLTLQRAPEQRPMQKMALIPLPSQLDDWRLFQKYEGDMIRQKRGEQGFVEWKTAKAEERVNLAQWRRAMELGTELRLLSRSATSGSEQDRT